MPASTFDKCRAVTTYTYDKVGKRLSVTDNTGVTKTYGYDADSRLTSETTPTGTTSYTYDAVGNRLTKVRSAGTTTYSYDLGGDDRLLAENGATTNTYAYDANGNMTSVNGIPYTYSFEDKLTGIGTTQTPQATYVYDADDNRVQKTEWSGGVSTVTNSVVDADMVE